MALNGFIHCFYHLLSVFMALLQCIILSPSFVNISLLCISKPWFTSLSSRTSLLWLLFLKAIERIFFNMGLTNHPVSDVLHSHPACFKQVNTSLKLAKNHDTIIKYYWWKKLKKKKVVSGIRDIFSFNLCEQKLKSSRKISELWE